jgi:hypothetical protein
MEGRYRARKGTMKDLTSFHSSHTVPTNKDNYNSDKCNMYCRSNKCKRNFDQDLSTESTCEEHGWTMPQ